MRARGQFGLIFSVLGLLATAAAPAHANDVRWSVTIGSPGYHRPPPVVVAPPVIYAPPPVVYPSPQVVHVPPPVVVSAPYMVHPAPVVVHPQPVMAQPTYIVVPPGHAKRWHKHHWKHGHGYAPGPVFYGHPGHRYHD